MKTDRVFANGLLICIVMIGLAARIFYLVQISAYPDFSLPAAGADAELNHEIAKRIASGDLLLGEDVYYFSAVLYKYFLGGLYALFGTSFWTARICNILMGMANIVFVYVISFKLFRRDVIALIASFGAALYGPFVYFDTSMLNTTLAVFMLALSIILIINASKKPKKGYWFAAGLFLGLTYSNNPQVAIFILFVVICLLAGKEESEPGANMPYISELPRRILKVSLLLSGVALALLPFAARNYYVSGTFTVNSVDGIHIYIGNHKGAWGGYSKVDGIRSNVAGHYYDAKRIAEKESGRVLSASEASMYWKAKALNYAVENPADFLRLIKSKAQLFFSFSEKTNNGNYQYLTSLSSFFSCLPNISILLPLGMSGLILSFREFRRYWVLYILFISYFAALMMTFVSWRYRLPVTLVLWPFAAYMIVTLFDLIKKKNYLSLFAASALMIYFVVLGYAHPVNHVNDDKAFRGAAARMEASRKEGELLEKINSGGSMPVSDRSSLWLQIARLRYQFQDTEGAARIISKALADDPDNDGLKRELKLMIDSQAGMNAEKQEI